MRHIAPMIVSAIAAVAIVSSAGQAAETACSTDPLFRQLDFALGHWDVLDTEQKKTAEVKMESVLSGCAIHETWLKPDGGGAGLGLFNYSLVLKAWSYAWVADTGSSTIFKGNLTAPGIMRFVTERPSASGGVRVRHWTLSLLSDGRVREFSVGSEDGGATWTTEYDLYWRKHG